MKNELKIERLLVSRITVVATNLNSARQLASREFKKLWPNCRIEFKYLTAYHQSSNEYTYVYEFYKGEDIVG
jgi:hypothetical protein